MMVAVDFVSRAIHFNQNIFNIYEISVSHGGEYED